MNAPKLCPHCGGDVFMAYIKRGGMVRSVGVDENGKPVYEIMREGAKDNFELEIIKCSQCKTTISESDLVDSAHCKTCNKVVNPSELDDNGNCAVCQLLTANPEVENASKEDLLRMLAEAYRANNSTINRMHAKVEKGKAVEASLTASADDNAGEELAESDNQAQEENVAEEVPTRRRRVRRTKDAEEVANDTDSDQMTIEETMNMNAPDAAEAAPAASSEAETHDATPEPQVDVSQEEAVIAYTQAAPFPDVQENMIIPENAAPAVDAQVPVSTGGFQMFDGEGEPF